MIRPRPLKPRNPCLFRFRTRVKVQEMLGPIEWNFSVRDTFGNVALSRTGPITNTVWDALKERCRKEPDLLIKVMDFNPEYDKTGKILEYLEEVRLSGSGNEQNTFLTIHGPTGVGKSLTGLVLRSILDPIWDIRKICMTRAEIMERANVFKFNVCFQQDEDENDYGQDIQSRAAEYKNFFNAVRRKKVSGIVCTAKPEAMLDILAKWRLDILCRSADGNWSLAAVYEGQDGQLTGYAVIPHPKFILAPTITEAETLLSQYFFVKDEYMDRLQSRDGLGNSEEDVFKRNDRILWYVDAFTSLQECIKERKDGRFVLEGANEGALWSHIDSAFPFKQGNQMIGIWAKQFKKWFEGNYEDLSTIQYPSREQVRDLRKRVRVEKNQITGKILHSDYKEGKGDFREIMKIIRARETGMPLPEIKDRE